MFSGCRAFERAGDGDSVAPERGNLAGGPPRGNRSCYRRLQLPPCRVLLREGLRMTDTIEMRWSRHHEAGRSYFSLGDLARADQAFVAAIREAKAMGGDGLYLATSLGSLGQLRYRQGDYPRAEALFRHALAIREQALGPDDHGIVQSINNLAALHYVRGALADAEPLFRRALTISEAHLGLNHPDLAVGLNNLAKLYIRLRDFRAAAPLLVRLARIKEEVQGPHHLETASVLLMLARVHFALRETSEAERLCRDALEVQESVLPSDDATVTGTRALLAEIVAARPAAAGDQHEPASGQDQAVAPKRFSPQQPPLRQGVRAEEMATPAAAYPQPGLPPEALTLPRPTGEIQILTSAGDSLGGQPLPPIAAPPSECYVPNATEPVAPQIDEHVNAAPPRGQASPSAGDGWSLDPRDVSDGAAGITHIHAPDLLAAASPAAAASHREGEGEGEEQEQKAEMEPGVSFVGGYLDTPEGYRDPPENEWLDDPAGDMFEARGRESRRAMRPWPQQESRAKTAAIAAAVALVLLAGGWFAFLKDDAEASATPLPPAEAPSTSERPVEPAVHTPEPSSTKIADAADAIVDPAGGFDRGVPTEAERVRMGVAESGRPRERERVITSGDPLEPPPLPNVRVNLDPLSRSIARTKARVDSLGREIPVEPIQFQRP